ncbi:hypothetical protein DB88DRAFT_477422 [Papiliotrema laurentii]|uniref:Ribosome biogenesis protein SLX9 n=1 Tax=Papiliotrema laurentii TaxID=5418 RepID=A0AAD9FWE8_PAPLA|nr:hypothetical protein DB88DRAFT_477422 [Papiliotrema laurentii]
MPRASRTKASKHSAAVQLPSKRSFAVPEGQVVGSIIPEASEAGPSKEIGPSDVSFSKLKKGKLPATVPEVISPHPYSRSHVRREKRKAKQHLAGGDLGHLSTALSEVMGDAAPPSPPPTKNKLGQHPKPTVVKKKGEDRGKIGEGRGRTMSEHARRKQIALEAKRIPAIVQHPAYKASPWSTIRLHASNSLATVPPVGSKKPEKATGGMEVE